MSTPFYVAPEQWMKDRAEFARAGIARGRSVVVLSCADGIVLAAQNPSRTLHKVAEIHDRIGFAAVGRYTEFENLRVAGIRHADLRGYSYDRSDVDARGLAGAYAQTLATVFTQEAKPYEVEIVLAEVGPTPEDDELYRLTYDGSVTDERGFVAIGGAAEPVGAVLRERWSAGLTRDEAARLALAALEAAPSSTPATTPASARGETPEVEVALLDRRLLADRTAVPPRARRTFRRLTATDLAAVLGVEGPGDPSGH
ncbi:proteasome subunit alpha [Mobilicoccus pelagius]|uniref:Proteasome subunit alpha n=1 Tax=Mobilicoccus pelagius NBRC 104925 TaxID=1089455 RepID=H5UTF9_9MICO|nr:proteasome subunit alpha [Mobilicoccus pelagius]GAB49017.1 20S proteasome alpha subunit [Mobilicoccus pelagius NBRC 104925]